MATALPHPRSDTRRLHVDVSGAVQGVGFRPFVWTLAKERDLAGWVLNDEAGVRIEVEGPADQLDDFLTGLQTRAPALARVDEVTARPCDITGETGFEIRKSERRSTANTLVTPDAATCPDCLSDMFDPANRRHLYPFTNCTHCGPRYTITRDLPYDRAQTSMAPFDMCPSCQAEYEDPADRRFHAQPNACTECGPQLSMAPAEIAEHVRAGRIVALKGLGGFHLIVDACNAAAVDRLRQRKRRDGKPFAVMVAGLPSARLFADIDPVETDALTSHASPIVICRAREEAGLAHGISNGLPSVGLMLPYTPVHHLLFHALCGAPDGTDWMDAPQPVALVMTSANPGGEPLVIGNDEAERRLATIADVIVTHDRDILIRCDDSVVRVINGAPAYLRRARGATPEPIRLPHAIRPTLALGAHLKTSVCVTRGDEAVLSQHIGDLDTQATRAFFRETVSHLLEIMEVQPERVACDLHPDFFSTRFAEETDLPIVRVQHHHAHIAAVAAEHGIDAPVIGLALDGFGLGTDSRSSWGGELLSVDGPHFERLGGFAPLLQPGGDRAAREPWRMGAAALHTLARGDEIETRFQQHEGAGLLAAMLERKLNTPETSSAGRLFDAACGLLGVKPIAASEGDAPMALEALARTPRILKNGWTVEPDGTLNLLPLLDALTELDPVAGAELFHGTLAAALCDWTLPHVRAMDGPARVLASGGCLQNSVLAEALKRELSQHGIDLLLPRRAPANDGGLSLGQAWIAGKMALEEITQEEECHVPGPAC